MHFPRFPIWINCVTDINYSNVFCKYTSYLRPTSPWANIVNWRLHKLKLKKIIISQQTKFCNSDRNSNVKAFTEFLSENQFKPPMCLSTHITSLSNIFLDKMSFLNHNQAKNILIFHRVCYGCLGLRIKYCNSFRFLVGGEYCSLPLYVHCFTLPVRALAYSILSDTHTVRCRVNVFNFLKIETASQT